MMKKRLDQLLVDKGFFETRARAQQTIKQGHVSVAGDVILKPAYNVNIEEKISISDDANDFVSRGALKLVHGLEHFHINPEARICVDIGASTGGFCDVLLRRGVAKIYAVDVGHGQLSSRIAADTRIINLEKTNAKDLSGVVIPELVSLLVCDVSFISLRKALPAALDLMQKGGEGVILIKPQFELGRNFIGKGGIVNADANTLKDLTDDIEEWFSQRGFASLGVTDSPIKGGDGNKEFLIGVRKVS